MEFNLQACDDPGPLPLEYAEVNTRLNDLSTDETFNIRPEFC